MNIKFFTILLAVSFGLMIVSAIVGNILESKGVLTKEMIGLGGITAVVLFYIFLFCLMAVSLVPVALRFFLNMQIKIGNDNLAIIKWLQTHEQTVVFGFWGLILVGFIIMMILVKPADIMR